MIFPGFWIVVVLLGLGTYLIRLSFLGLIGDRPLPPFVLRVLRYTPVAVLPGMVAPIVLLPGEAGADWPLVGAAAATLLAGGLRKSLYWGAGAGVVTFFALGLLLG